MLDRVFFFLSYFGWTTWGVALFSNLFTFLFSMKSRFRKEDFKYVDFVAKLFLLTFSIPIFDMFIRFVLYRPDLQLRGMTQVGVWYIPPNNLLSVIIAGIILLIVTKSIFCSLYAGASSTMIWQTVMARPNLLLEGKEPFIIHDFERGTIMFAFLMLILVPFWTISLRKHKHFNKIVLGSFLLFATCYLLFSFFPQTVAPNWLRIHLGGEFRMSSIPELAFDIVLRSSGYLFFSLLIIKSFTKLKECVTGLASRNS